MSSERRPSRRGSANFKGFMANTSSSSSNNTTAHTSPHNASSSSSAPVSMLRLLVIAILSLGLFSISLQGYEIIQQRNREATTTTVVSTEHLSNSRPIAVVAAQQSPLLRKSKTPVDQHTKQPRNPEQEQAHKPEQDQEQEQNEKHQDVFALAGISGEPRNKATPTTTAPATYPDVCEDERDWGIVQKIQQSAKVYCADASAPQAATKVTVFNLTRGGFKAVLFQRRFRIDLRGAKVYKPIKSMAQDGGRHDPRFLLSPKLLQCECEELHKHAIAEKKTHNRTLELWENAFGKLKKHDDPPTLVCAAGGPVSKPVKGKHMEIKEKTLLITRKDDHNPFFQVSNALNAWILVRALGWENEPVRVIHLDGGYPSPIDDLHRKMLSPQFPILKGVAGELLGQQLEFTNDVAHVPYEVTGPMMQHLNDYEPCEDSQLFQEFRDEALKVMELPTRPARRTQITITVISRRNYGGRRVQRTLRNEKELLDQMRKLYPTSPQGLPVVFQSIDFVNLTLSQQMDLMQTSDVVIGMHGAGMVNVFWTRPDTLVVEIFPKHRHRWGYRNLCQFLGCDWHQFRGGKDTGKGQNNSHKMIPWAEWKAFFDPLFQDVLSRVAAEEEAVAMAEGGQADR